MVWTQVDPTSQFGPTPASVRTLVTHTVDYGNPLAPRAEVLAFSVVLSCYESTMVFLYPLSHRAQECGRVEGGRQTGHPDWGSSVSNFASCSWSLYSMWISSPNLYKPSAKDGEGVPALMPKTTAAGHEPAPDFPSVKVPSSDWQHLRLAALLLAERRSLTVRDQAHTTFKCGLRLNWLAP